MNSSLLRSIAKQIVSKTILATDESTSTIKKRLATIGIDSTPEINRQYRELLFAADGIEKYVSAVILFDETIRQSTTGNKPFPKFLEEKGILPGIKVDKGIVPITTLGVDMFTQGLDGLTKKLDEYRLLGAKFAKWRAVFTIAKNCPSTTIVRRNSHDLALYALLCQEANIVPIVEPEILMAGDHSLEEDRKITENVLNEVFEKIKEYGVDPQGMILKPNMITAGEKNGRQADIDTVATFTIKALMQTVPQEVAGIAFLSGGQTPDLATAHLNVINKIKNSNPSAYPWRITASYGRALQGETLEAWAGKKENIVQAQKVFINRAKKVFEASMGRL